MSDHSSLTDIDLRRQLAALRAQLDEMRVLGEQALQSNREFNERMRAELDGLALTVEELEDVGSLKRVLGLTSKSLDAHLEEKKQQDEERQVQFAQSLAEASTELGDLEQQTAPEAVASADSAKPLDAYPDRETYETLATAEFARHRDSATPLSLVFFGVDQLTSVNDRFGHKAGDQVLRVIVGLIAAEVEPFGTLARYAGGEFACLLRHTELSAAQQLAEQVRQSVRAFRFHSKGERVPIGLSCGIAQLDAEDSGMDSLTERAYHDLHATRPNDSNPPRNRTD